MLNLVMDGVDVPSKPVIHNVEYEFARVKLEHTPKVDRLLEEIEQGTWADESGFIDRFGYKLYWSELSTGCKAALLVDQCKDKCIDLAECGDNAIESILKHCRDGEVLSRVITWEFNTDGECDVVCHGKRFISMQALSDYLYRGDYIEI